MLLRDDVPSTPQRSILNAAAEVLRTLAGRRMEVLEVRRPDDLDYAVHLGKVISKLSPLIGNMLEFRITQYLNAQGGWERDGTWIRQDPYFPDTTFTGELQPQPGIEIKTWFPLATEITARFKDSQRHFIHDNIDVALVAWLPEHLIWGQPKILDVWIAPARGVAEARDTHYHRPPDYLVLEPEDTSQRAANLQQTNTNGYKIQLPASKKHAERVLAEAQAMVESWGPGATTYDTSPEYQKKLRELMGRFKYRLDTNFAKMDRIQHDSLEDFKTRVLDMEYEGVDILSWARALNRGTPEMVKRLL